MSDETRQLRMLEDASGDISSGRVMKMQAFWAALALSVIGMTAIVVLGWLGKPGIAAELSDYLKITVGMYLGVAAGAEVVQKVTGK